jgi:hypothetical protein
MARIVTSIPRPKRPPKKRKLKPAPAKTIVTVKRKRKLGSQFADVLEMTPEEHKRRGDAADALFRELVRRASAEGSE